PLLIEAKHAKVHVKSFNGKTVKVNKHVHVNKNVYVKNKNIYVNKKVAVLIAHGCAGPITGLTSRASRSERFSP
ncbi:MAG TPA: hypothetical protein VI390_02150, partial [Methyloceanibacter sp.]